MGKKLKTGALKLGVQKSGTQKTKGKSKTKLPPPKPESSFDNFIKAYEEQHKEAGDPKEHAKLKNLEPSQVKKYLQRKQQQFLKEMKVKYNAYLAGEAVREETERNALVQKQMQEFEEVPIRQCHLLKTRDLITRAIAHAKRVDDEIAEKEEWDYYISCNRLPYPQKTCRSLADYIHYWKKEQADLSKTETRCNDVIFLLSLIDKQHERRIDQEWDGVKKELQVLLEKSMNYSTYLIMKNISKNMTVIKEKTAILTKNSKYFSFNLYTRIPLPNQLPNYSPIEIIFDDSLPDKIVIPYRIDLRTMVVRYMIFKYDHKTWTCETYKDPDCPDEYEVDMKTYCDHLWLAKPKMKFRRHPVKKDHVEGSKSPTAVNVVEVVEIPDDLPALQERIDYNRAILPVPSEELLMQEVNMFQTIQRCYDVPEVPNQLNLRQYLIVGDIMCLNLLLVPRQPKEVMPQVTIVANQLPKKLHTYPYLIDIPDDDELYQNHDHLSLHAPSVDSNQLSEGMGERTSELFIEFTKVAEPEPIEAENMTPEQILYAEKRKFYEQMITWTMRKPDTVYWFEKPILCIWHQRVQAWSTKYIYNVNINDQERTITAQVGRCGFFGLAVKRYLCFPFQFWTLEPGPDEHDVIFTLTTQLYKMKLTVRGNKIALTDLSGIPWSTINPIEKVKLANVFYPLYELKAKMERCGLNIFTSHDTFLYVEQTSPKNWVLERHIYYCMAHMARGHNFKFSKWSVNSGRMRVYLQIQDILFKSYKLVDIDANRACYVMGQEHHTDLDRTPLAAGNKFSADLYNLYLQHGTSFAKTAVLSTPKEQPYTLFQLLSAIKPLSFTHPVEHKSSEIFVDMAALLAKKMKRRHRSKSGDSISSFGSVQSDLTEKRSSVSVRTSVTLGSPSKVPTSMELGSPSPLPTSAEIGPVASMESVRSSRMVSEFSSSVTLPHMQTEFLPPPPPQITSLLQSNQAGTFGLLITKPVATVSETIKRSTAASRSRIKRSKAKIKTKKL